MKRSLSRYVLLLLSLALLLLLFSCGASSSDKKELWVVTEKTVWDGMNGQLTAVKKAFEKAHGNVTVRVETLPTDEVERSVALQRLRTRILQGGGPDCYLLPTGSRLVLDEPAQYEYVDVEPLFSDVDFAMRSGLFLDVSSWYEADEALGKESLNEGIMAAGRVGGRQYVLPLRYDVPVIYAKTSALLAAGLDPSLLEGDILSVMEAVYETGDPHLAGGLLYTGMNAFSAVVDYDTGKATVDAELLSRYMTLYRKLLSLLGDRYVDFDAIEYRLSGETVAEGKIVLEKLDVEKYIYCAYGEWNGKDSGLDYPSSVDNVAEYYSLWVGSLQDAFDYAAVSQFEGEELTVVPLRTADGGDVVASVTYYAAVGAGCDDGELAYEFLRMFLLEESQWEKNRPERTHTNPWKGSATNSSNDLQYPGLIDRGFPVRDKDAFQKLWSIRRLQFYRYEMGRPPQAQKVRMRKIGLTLKLEEERIPSFGGEVDAVRFNTTLSDSFAELLSRLNGEDNAPTDVDVDALAEEMAEIVSRHAQEG